MNIVGTHARWAFPMDFQRLSSLNENAIYSSRFPPSPQPLSYLRKGPMCRGSAVPGHCYNVHYFCHPPHLPILLISPNLSHPKSHRCFSSYKQKHKGDSRVGHPLLQWSTAPPGIQHRWH